MNRNKKYNSKNGRKNMRLRGYDYSRAGLYFLTPVVQNRLHLFGKITLGATQGGRPQMILNDAGRMVEKWYWEIENKYPDKRCHQMVVMPNHFHCIIENLDIADGNPNNDGRPKYGIDNKRYGATIGDVMGWFQTMTTNEYIRGVKQYNWKRFDGKLWQRNFYDHIIRNDKSYERIHNYILTNPEKWDNDNFFNE